MAWVPSVDNKQTPDPTGTTVANRVIAPLLTSSILTEGRYVNDTRICTGVGKLSVDIQQRARLYQ